MPAPELGIPSDYTVAVRDRGGSVPVTDPLPFAALTWGRVLDDTSSAQVDVNLADAPWACDQVAQLRTWRHELVVYRDQVRVWEGPLTNIAAGRSTVTLVASDVSAWLSRRLIRERMCWAADCGGSQADLGDVARALIEHGLTPDDPNVLPYLDMRTAGIVGERSYEAWSTYVGDELAELARTAIDWTVIGRRIVGGAPDVFGTLPVWTCDAFAGDVQTVEDGDAAATRAALLGGVPPDPNTDDDVEPDPVVGLAGGTDAYYGLLELVAKDDTIVDQRTADLAAQAAVTPQPPLYVNVPSGATLAPSTPAGINDLVPGVLVPVDLDCVCRPVSTTLRLASMSVRWGDDGEQVTVALVPPVPAAQS